MTPDNYGWLLLGTWSDGQERDLAIHTTAEAALVDRDKRRANGGGTAPPEFHVFQEGERDKGELEWCGCGNKAGFNGRCPGDES